MKRETKTKTKTKKLMITKEKVRDLTKDQLNDVNGGFFAVAGSEGCGTRTTSA